MVRIADDALVVRGGNNRPEDIRRGMGTHPSGVTGISVECGIHVTIMQLVMLIPHGQIGVTTVAEVRETGGDVIRTSGRSPYHATSCNFDRAYARTSKSAIDTNCTQSRPGEENMKKPRIYVDFHNADTQERLRLNCTGTIEDLGQHRVLLHPGQTLQLYSEDLEVEDVVTYSTEENLWVAVINWDDIHEVAQPAQLMPVAAD